MSNFTQIKQKGNEIVLRRDFNWFRKENSIDPGLIFENTNQWELKYLLIDNLRPNDFLHKFKQTLKLQLSPTL